MKKIFTMLLGSSLLMSFIEHPKSIIAGIAIIASQEVKAQYLTKTEADSLYKHRDYVPTLQLFGYNFAFDSSGIFYHGPQPAWPSDIYNYPVISNVGISGDYRDLSFLPQIPNPGVSINTYGNQWNVDSTFFASITNVNGRASKNTSITIKSGTYTSTQDLNSNLSYTLPTFLITETQSLSISSNSLSIKTGSAIVNTIVLPSATSQSLTLSTNSLTISGSNTIVFKRQEKYSGSTDATGIYSVTFTTAYSSVPDIQANVINGNNKWTQITNVSTTGFTVYIQLRTDIAGLLPTYSNVSGATIRVLISEQ